MLGVGCTKRERGGVTLLAKDVGSKKRTKKTPQSPYGLYGLRMKGGLDKGEVAGFKPIS